MQTSNTVAPQAMAADLRGSNEDDRLISLQLGSAWAGRLFSISSFFT